MREWQHRYTLFFERYANTDIYSLTAQKEVYQFGLQEPLFLADKSTSGFAAFSHSISPLFIAARMPFTL
ncbi:hypothetical protein CCAN2_2020057 [Capnocytophaga canimorsus]|nr:hypothetical protein CCAN2_2020057 [Capnocytophaga canimorsus]